MIRARVIIYIYNNLYILILLIFIDYKLFSLWGECDSMIPYQTAPGPVKGT